MTDQTGGGRFAVTIANPLGARQEAATGASLENIVTAVREFSESLLTNRASKEVQQEVKALVTHLEVLVTRRQRVAARNSRSPSVAETRVALRNLKQFLEQEAQKETAVRKTSEHSCTSDSLDSSESRVQAFSPYTGTRSLAASGQADPPRGGATAASCGSRGDADSCRGGCRRLQPQRVGGGGLGRDKLRLPSSAQPEPNGPANLQEPWKTPPKDTAPLRAGRVVRLTCSERHHFLLLLPTPEGTQSDVGNQPDAFGKIVHVATESAQPMSHPPAELAPATRECLALAPQDSHDCLTSRGCCCHHLRSRSPVRAERPPFMAANRRLEEELPRLHVLLAVEKTVELPVLMAETRCPHGCLREPTRVPGGIEQPFNSTGGAVVKCPVGKAVVAEQGNFHCDSVSSRVAVVSWAKAAVAETFIKSDSPEVTGHQASSNQLLSTCSCPSDSEAKKDAENDIDANVAKRDTHDSVVDIQSSSAALVQHLEAPRLGHGSIKATSMRLELRVCESCSQERPVPATNIVASAGEEQLSSDLQQPLFRIVDLFRLVQLAEPLGRSGSPREALEVAVDGRQDAAESTDDEVDQATVQLESTSDCESNCSCSNPTLEVVDQGGATPEAAAEAVAESDETAKDMAMEPQVTPALVPSVAQDAGAQGCTWSSCEVGQSSGFTKLLLTLDKAAKRRREKAWRERQRSAMVAGTSRSGNNSTSHRSRPQRRRLKPAPSTTPLPPASAATNPRCHQEVALKLAADSLAALSESLQQCVRRVQEAADAMNCSL